MLTRSTCQSLCSISQHGNCRLTPQTTPGTGPPKPSSPHATRSQATKQDQHGSREPKAAEADDAAAQGPETDHHHRRHSPDSRQHSGDRQPSEAGSDQEGGPLVQYQDEERHEYNDEYEGAEQEAEGYDREGSAQRDQQYDDEDGRQQQYGSGDEQQGDEDDTTGGVQYDESMQPDEAAADLPRRSRSAGSEAPDEWDINPTGDSAKPDCSPVFSCCTYVRCFVATRPQRGIRHPGPCSRQEGYMLTGHSA